MNKTEVGQYIVHLIYSLLNDKVPSDKPEQCSFEDIYQMSVFHNITIMVLEALKKTNQEIPPEILAKWSKKAAVANAQNVVQFSERERIYRAFEENQVDYLPLKGYIIKSLYPEQKFRQMSDLDILIREADNLRVKSVLEQLGYRCEKFGQEVDDQYSKDPYMKIEIHYRLFGDLHFDNNDWNPSYIPLLLDPWKYAEQTASQYQYRFTDDDFYIYFILHLAKHYFSYGSGIRQFLDLYFLNHKLNLNKELIYEQLDLVGLKEFCITAEQMVSYWFHESDKNGMINDMEQTVFLSGSYGTKIQGVKREIEKYNEYHKNGNYYLFYLKNRLFPSLNIMKFSTPMLRKHPVLLPVYWVKRIVTKGIIAIPKEIHDIRLIKKIMKEKEDCKFKENK